ncbi:trypsin-like peptidase domain-containing protein [Streptomyces sp. NPDC006172]|uniref:trypsin-like serine peptidase n=1 Tax=Streptomyces sp. NPDC006172 TaxID=3154470 RepID=UPI0033CFDED9
MKRTRTGRRPYALLCVLVLLAATSASEAVAGDGPGPLGVTVAAPATARTVRVGALFDRSGGDLVGGHFCTASVVRSPHRDLIVTAAHCLADRGALYFAPGYREGKAPYGMWEVERVFLPEGWTAGKDEDSDVAFAVLAGNGDGEQVEDVVGGNRFVTGSVTGTGVVTVTGYPDAVETPLTCHNRPVARSATQQRIDCPDFAGGTSGSPWVNGSGGVVGVLGGHEQGGATADVSYSVVLGGGADALYREATTAP